MDGGRFVTGHEYRDADRPRQVSPRLGLLLRGHFDVPNRAERIWPLTGKPGAAGERPLFRPMTSAGKVNVGRSDSFASLCMQGKHLAGHCRTAHAERLLLPGQVIES